MLKFLKNLFGTKTVKEEKKPVDTFFDRPSKKSSGKPRPPNLWPKKGDLIPVITPTSKGGYSSREIQSESRCLRDSIVDADTLVSIVNIYQKTEDKTDNCQNTNDSSDTSGCDVDTSSPD